MVRIDVLLTERQIAEEFAAAFADRNLPEKFFYWFPLSVKAWLSLCGDGAYRNFSRSMGLLQQSGEQIAAQLPRGEVEVVSLGAGQGNKDLLLLEALRSRGGRPAYMPVDASQSLLEMACDAAERAGFASRGMKADLARPDHLEALRPDDDRPRLVLLLGNTLGAFEPAELLGRLAGLLRPGDHLLVDGELYGGPETLAGYDNPLNRQFAIAPLRSLGISDDDGELVFELRADSRQRGLYRVSKYFRAARDFDVRVAGEIVPLVSGERVEMNFSCKYSEEAFMELVGGPGGMKICSRFLSPDGRFLMVLARSPSKDHHA